MAAGVGSRTADGTGSVSYTHLDVYKRQVLYHCVAGVAPIEAPGRVLDDPLRLAEELASGRYSQGLLRLIDRAMAVRPEKRFQTVAQMRTALEARMDDDGERTVKLELPLRSDLHRSGEKPRLVIVDPPKTPLKSRRLDWRWGVGILAVLAIAGGGIAIWKGQVPSTQVEQPSHPLASLKHSGPPASPQPGQIYADPGTVWILSGCHRVVSSWAVQTPKKIAAPTRYRIRCV